MDVQEAYHVPWLPPLPTAKARLVNNDTTPSPLFSPSTNRTVDSGHRNLVVLS